MKRIKAYPVAVALSMVFLVLYVVCVGLHSLLPDVHPPMYRVLELTLIGFHWFTPLGFLLGAIEVMLGGFYVAYLFVALFNLFSCRFGSGGGAMKPLEFRPFALSVVSFGVITYLVCILFDLVVPSWSMQTAWQLLLPGFERLAWGDFFIGLFWVIVYGAYASGVFVPVYNFFVRSRTARLGSEER